MDQVIIVQNYTFFLIPPNFLAQMLKNQYLCNTNQSVPVMKYFLPLLLLALLSCTRTLPSYDGLGALSAEQDSINRVIYQRVYDSVVDMRALPTHELVMKIAEQFLGTDYVSYTLEHEPEHLLVYLDQTDCILFVEMCSCFAMTVKASHPSYELLLHNIQQMRYRNGVVDGYASRVHYTSEWILQNAERGVMREITHDLGGEEHEQEFYFMTTHRDSYRQLKNDSVAVAMIRQVEQRLQSTGPYYCLTQDQLRDPVIMAKIQSGDIITFIDTHPGLDLAHVALAYDVDGEMHFIHASYGAKHVIVEPRTLAEYASNGIRVFRFNE